LGKALLFGQGKDPFHSALDPKAKTGVLGGNDFH
jgi:hypothetical protein